MNRRAFLEKFVGGVAASAAVRTWPYRVFSFPSKVEIAKPQHVQQIRIIRAYDPVQHRMFTRYDMLAGFATLEVGPELVNVIGFNPLLVERGKQ